MNVTRISLLFGAGLAAGLMNAIAGGGTIVTFPALILAGISSIDANATSTVALLPGTLAGIVGYRSNLPAMRQWIRFFVPVSAFGGLLGGILLTVTPTALFDRLVPFLILFATALFTSHALFVRIFRLKTILAARDISSRGMTVALIFQFMVAVYGGYFGAGIGILMLASLAMMGFANIHEMNVVKGVIGFLINAVAAAYFISVGLVDWAAAVVVALGSIAGGYSGAHFAQKISQQTVRYLITAVGLFITAIMFYKQFAKS